MAITTKLIAKADPTPPPTRPAPSGPRVRSSEISGTISAHVIARPNGGIVRSMKSTARPDFTPARLLSHSSSVSTKPRNAPPATTAAILVERLCIGETAAFTRV